MKRRDLTNQVSKLGYYPKKIAHKHPKHEPWTNGIRTEMIPRGREINESTAEAILKRCKDE